MVSTPKHTPGPWLDGKIDPADGTSHEWMERVDGDNVFYAMLSGDDYDRACAAVNACAEIPSEKLRAGAVKGLLEACMQALGWLESEASTPTEPMTQPTEMLRVLRAAIAKAEGK